MFGKSWLALVISDIAGSAMKCIGATRLEKKMKIEVCFQLLSSLPSNQNPRKRVHLWTSFEACWECHLFRHHANLTLTENSFVGFYFSFIS